MASIDRSAGSLYSSSAYEINGVIKATEGILLSFSGYNSLGSAQWIHIYDAAAVPANGAVPKLIIYAAASSNFSYDAGAGDGLRCSNGICFSNSTTGPTKTAGLANVFMTALYS